MQAKDIPEQPILDFLASRNGKWAHWFTADQVQDNSGSVLNAMPEGTPQKVAVALAKMRSMIKRGLVKGCGCGCRGDFHL